MKKFKSIIALGLASAVLSTVGLAACSTVDEYALSCYRGEKKDASGNTVYNTELFYSNQVQQGYPDPQVLDNTARDGYYYLYGTSGNFAAMRSKNLADWENVGTTYNKKQQGDRSAEVEKTTWLNNWAPEVIYDDATKLYYLFFSATPDYNDTDWNTVNDKENGVVSSASLYNMYVATSSSPTGPFMLVDFTDANTVGADNVHTYNTTAGKEITKEQAENGEFAYVVKDEKYFEAAFPHKWAKYCLFAPDELSKLMQKNGVGTGGSAIKTPDAGYIATIDPSPFVNPVDGKKYLYFKTEAAGEQWNINVVVEMKDWLTPIWSTATYVTANGYSTIEDWKKGENPGVSYETTYCNEGPFVLYHKDKNGKNMYYFTYSVNDYSTSDYQVGMAVGNDPRGPFRKLTEEEGGLLLCSSTTDSDSVSGAGHHSFVTLGDQLFIAYHRHRDFMAGGGDRYTAVDEVKFITVTDINGEEMEVPYVNGPTDSMQPLPEGFSGYKNVASQATIGCTDKDAELEWISDGLLSVHKTANENFMDYVRETYITKTSTFNFDFEKDTSIRAIMVYNSAFEKSVFTNISRIELTLADGSVRVIRDVKFDVDQYCTIGGQNNDTIKYVKSGSAAFAEFYDVNVKSVKITVDLPEGQDEVGISEIKILGKA